MTLNLELINLDPVNHVHAISSTDAIQQFAALSTCPFPHLAYLYSLLLVMLLLQRLLHLQLVLVVILLRGARHEATASSCGGRAPQDRRLLIAVVRRDDRSLRGRCCSRHVLLMVVVAALVELLLLLLLLLEGWQFLEDVVAADRWLALSAAALLAFIRLQAMTKFGCVVLRCES